MFYSVFHSQSDLVDALLNCKEPTLIFTSKNYQPDYKLTLPLVFPTHFPFGSGGIEEDRRTHVSIDYNQSGELFLPRAELDESR